MMLEDIQNLPDERGVHLDEVGVTGLRYPISVSDREHGKQDTIAQVSLSVSLAAAHKGAHLSRFLEVLDDHAGEVTQRTIPTLLAEIQRRLGTEAAQVSMRYPYFLRRFAPVSGAGAFMDYECVLSASADSDAVRMELGVRVPVASVCPCSKAISDYGAHNQRGHITINVRPKREDDGEFAVIWTEELIEIAEGAGSTPLYPILKRSDERHVTMAGYDNPVFVEDMVRTAAVNLRDDNRVRAFTVEAINDESIHNHGAFARVTWPPRDTTREVSGPTWS